MKLLLAAALGLFLPWAANACTMLPAGNHSPSPGFLHEATKVYLGKVREIWHIESDVYYALVDVTETLKGPPAHVVGVLIPRWHWGRGLCPCARLERTGDALIVYQIPAPNNRSEPMLLLADSVHYLGRRYVRELRALARELPDYRPPRERRGSWRATRGSPSMDDVRD